MTCPRLAVIGAPVALLVGLVAGLLGAASGPPASTIGTTGPPEIRVVLAELGLSKGQREKISGLLDEASGDVRRLAAVSRTNARRLRSAELEQPFDARFVNELIERQAVLMAYARGRESRLLAEIGPLLSSEQRRRLEDLLVEETVAADPGLHRSDERFRSHRDRRLPAVTAGGRLPTADRGAQP